MKRFAVVLLALCVAQVAASGDTKTAVINKSPQVIDIIHKQGQFIFTDGSSSYIFKKDGMFESYPLERFSGRTIEATWQTHNQGFLINGV